MFQMFTFLAQLINLLIVLLFIRIILSWVMPQANPYNQPFKLIYAITEPVMAPLRALIPPMGGIDFSPMVLFLLLSMLQNLFAHLAMQ
jgi:YggT family protein